MTALQLFAFFVLPVVIVIVAAVMLLIERRRWRAASEPEPDLFARPRRAMANNDGLSRSRR